MRDTLLPAGAGYEEVYTRFRWDVPAAYNIAVDVCDRHARDRTRLAMVYEDADGRVSEHTFAEFRARSNQFARVLAGLGVRRGDRVGIVLPQRPETAVAHLAAYKLGAVALPLSTLFGPDALDYRLRDSGARVVVADAQGLAAVLAIRGGLPDLAHVVAVDRADAEGVVDYRRAVEEAPDSFDPVATSAEDPALIIYTSGTTGPPKGVLHAHRVLIGHLPAIEFYHPGFPQPADRFWTPADWAWIGGLIDVLLPAWHYGVPVVAHRPAKFDPERAFEIMGRHRVRNAFLVPTMLKMMRQVSEPRRRHRLCLRSIFTGGEPAGEEVIRWSQEALRVTPSEGYGQTEANLVLGNCPPLMPVRPGSMGRPVPGHAVEVLGEDGRPAPAGGVGEVAVRRPDPVLFLGYWRDPAATREKFLGDWALTGDLARKDPEGYFWFVSRKDDVILSGGYRIGPGEIEDCLAGHPAVALAAAIGVPDPVRGEVVKAFVQLREGVRGTPELARELSDHVRRRLAAHEYPREVEFVGALPTTTTGKIKRGDLRRLERERRSRGAV
jgi:acetyl-CoA synthetase